MDAEEELRKVIETVKAKRSQADADAMEQDRTEKYVDVTTKQAADAFVQKLLPELVAEMRPKVPAMWSEPVAMPAPDPPSHRQHSDFDHDDWTYSFRIGHGEVRARACGHTVALTVIDTKTGKKKVLLPIPPTRDSAIRTFNTVVEIGLS